MDWEHGHPDEQAVECYSLGTLSEEDEVSFEEHLLLCEPCQERVEESDDFIRALRVAATRVAAPRVEPPKPKPGPALRAFFPAPLAGALAAAVLTVVFLAPRNNPVIGVAAVHLLASRGAAAAAPPLPVVPARHSIDMELDATALPVRDRYVVELVDTEGRLLWTAPLAVESTSLRLSYKAGCPAGRYWVRVYDSSRLLLREYGFEVQ